MKIAIVGGGITGTITALLLAEAGQSVVIFERAADLLTRASTANEGKIHLGYVYGADSSFSTASRMIDDSLLFRPILERFFTPKEFASCLVDRFRYVVPRDSSIPQDVLRDHFKKVDQSLRARSQETGRRYISGEDHVDCVFSTAQDETGAHWFETQESGVWPTGIATLLRHAVEQHPRIEVRLQAEVRAIRERGNGWAVALETPDNVLDGPFDTVVNVAWADRKNIDERSGFPSDEIWLTRFKFGVLLDGAREAFGGQLPTNATGMLGAYGDSVYYPQNDTLYCSWYPVGRCFSTTGAFSLDWPKLTGTTTELAHQSWSGYARLDPSYVMLLDKSKDRNCRLIGDYIMAKGKTDIVDPDSGLHERYDHGPKQLAPGYWSVETGKYTSAPRVADQAVNAILGGPA